MLRDTLKLAVEKGCYKRGEMQERVDHFYASGKLTKEEYESLTEEVEANAPAEPTDAERIAALEAAVASLTERVESLERGARVEDVIGGFAELEHPEAPDSAEPDPEPAEQ